MMSEHLHPSLTELARFLDTPPGPEEARHLAACPRCRRELEGLAANREALQALPDPPLPSDGWPRLEAALAERGAPAGSGWRSVQGRRGSRQPTPWLRVAASVLLLLAGGLGGWWLGASGTGDSQVTGGATPVVESGPTGAELVATLERVLDEARRAELDAESAMGFAELTGELHRTALLRVREDEWTGPSEVLLDWEAATRFVALDHLVAAGREAVRAAPTDPYLNGLLLEVQAERDHFLEVAARLSGPDPWF